VLHDCLDLTQKVVGVQGCRMQAGDVQGVYIPEPTQDPQGECFLDEELVVCSGVERCSLAFCAPGVIVDVVITWAHVFMVPACMTLFACSFHLCMFAPGCVALVSV